MKAFYLIAMMTFVSSSSWAVDCNKICGTSDNKDGALGQCLHLCQNIKETGDKSICEGACGLGNSVCVSSCVALSEAPSNK